MAQESWNRDAADGSGCQQQEGLVLCTNNCGFFGCAATMNLCSKCFRELSLNQGNAFPAHATEKALAMAATAEKSMISALSDKSLVSMAQASLTPTISEKSFDKSVVATAMAQASPTPPAVSEKSSVSAAAMAQPSQSLSSLITVQNSGSEAGICSVRTFASSTSQIFSKSDLAPIAALFSSAATQPQPATRRRSVNRCLTCRKRTGLLGFKCRCGNVFCALHRYSDKHSCSYDYKSAGRDAIAKANPIVKAEKVEKI